MILATLPHIAIQIHMAFGSTQLFDNHFNIAHLLKIVSYLVPLSGLLMDYFHTYQLQKDHSRYSRMRETKLQAVLDTAIDGFVQIDMNGNIVAFNSSASRIFGYHPGEVIGKNVNILMPEPYHSEHDGYLQNYMTSGIPKVIGFRRELTAQRKDGSLLPIELGVAHVELEGEPYFVGVVTDISARVAAQEERDQTLKDLKLTNDKLVDFAYIASHDLKSPLRAIDRLSCWIEEDLADQFSDDTRDLFSKLRGRVNRMESLINGILDYSKAGIHQENPESTCLKDLIQEIVDFIDTPDNFKVDIPSDLPTLHTQKVLLHQVFTNLISNAFKYCETTNPKIRIGWQEKGDFFEFSVSDNGPGIHPKYHDKVFKVFQTLESRDKKESTGVGLAIVKKHIESNGGNITLESNEGEGATFRFLWPKAIKNNAIFK